MKELNLLTEWADSIVNEFDSSNVKAAAKKQRDPLAGDKDIARQAQTKYAGRDKEQALELFIADKLEDMEKRDLAQNKVINAQRRENDKLRKEITTLGQEVHDVVDDSAEFHKEMDRFRALAGQTKDELQDKRNQIAIGKEEFDKMRKDLDSFAKNGADPESVKAMKAELAEIQKRGSAPAEDFEELKRLMADIKASGTIDPKEIEALRASMEALKADRDKVSSVRQELKNLLKKDPKVFMANPLVRGIVRTQADLSKVSGALMGAKVKRDGLEGYSWKEINAKLRKNGLSQVEGGGILDQITDALVKTKQKTDNLPDKKELEDIKKSAAAIGDLPGRIEKSEERISDEEVINATQEIAIQKLAGDDISIPISKDVRKRMKNYGDIKNWDKTYKIGDPNEKYTPPNKSDPDYTEKSDDRLKQLRSYIEKNEMPSIVHMYKKLMASPRGVNPDEKTEAELTEKFIFPIMKKIYDYGIENLPDDPAYKKQWKKTVDKMMLQGAYIASDGRAVYAGNSKKNPVARTVVGKFQKDIVDNPKYVHHDKNPEYDKSHYAGEFVPDMVKNAARATKNYILRGKTDESKLTTKQMNELEHLAESILGPQYAKYLK